MFFEIKPFESCYQTGVLALIEQIQEGEFEIPIEEAQRQELLSIPESFRQEPKKGNYWVGLWNGKVIGTIAVLDIGHHAFELRDVFLDKAYRGKPEGYAKQLLDTVIVWANKKEVNTIYLGTTEKFKAAHKFYEKHGFIEIPKLPSFCQPMDCDTKFYCLNLKV